MKGLIHMNLATFQTLECVWDQFKKMDTGFASESDTVDYGLFFPLSVCFDDRMPMNQLWVNHDNFRREYVITIQQNVDRACNAMLRGYKSEFVSAHKMIVV